MTPIKDERKTKTIHYDEKTIESFWLETPASSFLPSSVDHAAQLKDMLRAGINDGVICVFSEELSSKSLCESLAKARDNGSRIYILTNNFSGEMKNLDGCLIRYGGSRKTGSFMLINPNSGEPSGCLFTGRLDDGSLQLPENLLLNLDAEQISVIFRYFCHQFWNLAEKERIGHGDRNIDFSPVDIYPPSDTGCDFHYLQSIWSGEMNGAYVTTTRLLEDSFFKFDNISNSNIRSLYSGISNDMVHSLAQKNNTIITIDNPCLVNSVKTTEGIWLVPKIDITPENEVYALLLNNDQEKVFDKHIINLLKSKTQYQYFESEKREKLIEKTIVLLGKEIKDKFVIKNESLKKLGDLTRPELLPKGEFDNREPDLPDDGISVSISYEWTNKPFVLLAGSSKHRLYNDWENTQKNIVSHIEKILKTISENENKEKTISNMLKRFFLGKQQNFKEYRSELETLQKITYSSLEKNDLQEKISKINAVYGKVVKDTEEIAEEDRKARIQERIDARMKEKIELKTELSGKEKELNDSKISRQELTDKFYEKGYIKKGDSLSDYRKTLEKKIETAKKEQKDISDALQEKNKETEQMLKELEDKKLKQQDTEDTLQKELSETKQTLKELENKKLKQQEADDTFQKKFSETKQMLEELEDKKLKQQEAEDTLQKKLSETEQTLKEIEDTKVKITKLDQDINSINDNIKKIDNEIKKLKGQLENSKNTTEKQKNFSVLDKMKGTGSKTVASAVPGGIFPVPQLEQLPSAGELHQHNGQNYLAIEYWEEYDDGKKEALRLNAKLCARGGK
jgi:hypothetical protein